MERNLHETHRRIRSGRTGRPGGGINFRLELISCFVVDFGEKFWIIDHGEIYHKKRIYTNMKILVNTGWATKKTSIFETLSFIKFLSVFDFFFQKIVAIGGCRTKITIIKQ